MVYSPHQWQDNNVGAPYGPISAARLGDMETGISDALLRAGDTMTGALTLTQDTANTFGVRAFSATAATGPVSSFRRGRGTGAAPLRVKSGDVLGQVTSSGYYAVDDVTAGTLAANRAYLLWGATEDWASATTNGEVIHAYSTSIGSGTAVKRLTIGDDGSGQVTPLRIFDPGVTHTAGQYRGIDVRTTSLGTISVSDRMMAVYGQWGDPAAAVNKTVSGAANNGSGLIRITTSTAHGFATGNKIGVVGVTGTTEANGAWTVTVIDTTNFDLQGSTFTNAYVSGGTATNRGMGYVFAATVIPTLSRGGLTGTAQFADDVACFVGYNGGTGKGTDAFYLGRNSTNFAGAAMEWATGITIEANTDYGLRLLSTHLYGVSLDGTFTGYGIDAASGTFTNGVIRFPNNKGIWSINNAGGTALEMLKLNTADEVEIVRISRFNANITIGNTFNIALSTSTGSKIATATTQKLGFWNAAPVAQPSATGETVGFTAGAGTNVTDASTFTGNVGSTAYRLSDIVKHLKNMGLIAA